MLAGIKFWQIIALIALGFGSLGILRLYWGGVHWNNELPFDGSIALFAGLIAFVAIIIQLEGERIARIEESDSQKRVSRIVLPEIATLAS